MPHLFLYISFVGIKFSKRKSIPVLCDGSIFYKYFQFIKKDIDALYFVN